MMEWETLHFLRPAWLLALLPALWLWYRLLRHHTGRGPWARVIAPHFLVHLQPTEKPPARWPVHGLLALWVTTILALSGPTWQQDPVPAHPPRTGTVIVLDLSLSMLATDVPPNRLTRARYKLIDLIRRHPQQPFGLVVYAGSAHVVTPIARDNSTLLNLLPTLHPTIMPVPGSRPDLAMHEAARLLTGAQVAQGHIIWVTDDLDHADTLKTFLARHDYTLAILAVGTPAGAPVSLPDGSRLKTADDRLVIPRLPWAALERFARETGATLTPLTLDDADLTHLLPPFITADTRTDGEEQVVYQWRDMGIWLVIPVVLGALLLFRRGWIFLWSSVILLPLLLGMPHNSQADTPRDKGLSDWRDLFRTPDQQGYQQWLAQHYERACDLFEDPAWKGAACWRAGRLQAAERAWRSLRTPEAFYNLGNLYVRRGAWQKAIEAYEQALRLRPDFPQARDNLQILKAFLARQQAGEGGSASTPQAAARPAATDRHAPDTPKPVQHTEAPSPATAPPRQDSPTASSKPAAAEKTSHRSADASHRQGTNTSDRKQSADSQPIPAAGMPDATSEPDPQGGAERTAVLPTPLDQWLEQIPDEPGRFLKRKFERQVQTRPAQPQDEKRW